MSNKTIDMQQGHWLLSKMGKRVLRPGGRVLTEKLIHNLKISPADRVIEFAPGIGYTAMQVLKNKPKSYTGIELNEEAAYDLRKKIFGYDRRILIANAADVPLEDNVADKVYGEAMLTMQADHRKSAIIQEASRLLRKGGYYGIHELGLTPDSIDDALKAQIQKDLSLCIKVNARPLTSQEWVELLEKEGFKIISLDTSPMLLLDTFRIVEDEGFFRSLKIGYNILRQPKARKRISEMKCVFDQYKSHMNAVAIVAQKL